MSVFKAGGAVAVARAIARRIKTPHARLFPCVRQGIQDAVGFEIGGPSPIFAGGGLLPIYPLARRIDNCNFAATTIWEGDIAEGAPFVFHPRKAPGRQVIAEGSNLYMIADGSYDFVLSSHMLEHTANPLRALREWGRLLKPGGALVLVVPHRDGTFDHRRPVTVLAHLVADFEQGMGEDDLTHLPEVLALHDAARDPGVHAISFRERAERNSELRSLHQHVFDTQLVVDVVTEAGLEVQEVEPLEPYHVVVLAWKPRPGTAARPYDANALRAILRASPFQTDRAAV